jgi:hypothetical protein
MPPKPMLPINGRSLADLLAKAVCPYGKKEAALPAAAATTDCFKKSRRECGYRIMDAP